MGFMDVIRNLAAGKPGFQDEGSTKAESRPDDQQPVPSPLEANPGATIRKHDAASYPKVELDRRLVVTAESDGRLSVHGRIKNSWPEEAWIEKITIFGKDQRMSESLHGHEDDDLELYKGAALTKQYPEAIMRYWVLNNVTKKRDYFQVVYRVTYTYDPKTNTQVPNEAQFIRIDDIFG